MTLERRGFLKLPYDPRVAGWAAATYAVAQDLTADPEIRARNLRHGATWFVGVDALPNDASGAVNGVPLAGPWEAFVPTLPQHAAQLSIIYPGYPGQDPGESDGAHRYRKNRGAAHVDGLLPEGPEKRRFAREFHAYILGIPLNTCACAPTLIWPESHLVIGTALRAALSGGQDVTATDITEVYQAARREVFKSTAPEPLSVGVGESFLIHRHALHGTAPWEGPAREEGRMVAFFRPEFASPAAWLAEKG